jgi:hypothetical protein
MKANWKVVVGSLLGAVAIHGVMAACGGTSGVVVAHDGGGGGGPLDALIEAFQGADAKAGTDGGTASPTTCAAWQITNTVGFPNASPTNPEKLGADEPFAVTFNPNLNQYVVWMKGCQ